MNRLVGDSAKLEMLQILDVLGKSGIRLPIHFNGQLQVIVDYHDGEALRYTVKIDPDKSGRH